MIIVIVGYPESGWGVSARREPSEPLLYTFGPTIDAACADMLVKLDEEPPVKRKLVRKPQR